MNIIIATAVFILSGLYLLGNALMTQPVKVGDVFVHANPGRNYAPGETANPFAMIYKVVELKDGKARVLKRYADFDGRSQGTYEAWEPVDGMGTNDIKISQ